MEGKGEPVLKKGRLKHKGKAIPYDDLVRFPSGVPHPFRAGGPLVLEHTEELAMLNGERITKDKPVADPARSAVKRTRRFKVRKR